MLRVLGFGRLVRMSGPLNFWFGGILLFSALLRLSAICAVAALPLMAEPPKVRQAAPDFSLPSIGGKTVRLSVEYAQHRVVLVVLRGFPGYQCPLCNRQVKDLLDHGEDFKSAGVSLLMIYPGPADELPSKAQEFLKDKNLPDHFQMLLDSDYGFTNAWGLRWDKPRETAYPSTFLIDSTGKILFAQISQTHGGRTTAEQILKELKKH